MNIVHLYDGHEKVYRGRGSVPNVVWNVARQTALAGHKVTVIERQWSGLAKEAAHDEVSFERISLGTGARRPWTRIPYEEVTSPTGLIRLMADRVNFALKAFRRLRGRSFDVLHVHLPFAANVLVTLAPSIRDRVVFTAHLGELRLGLLKEAGAARRNGTVGPGQNGGADNRGSSGPSAPGFLARFSPDIYLAKRAIRTTVLNTGIKQAFVQRGVPDERVTVIPNGVDMERFTKVSQSDLAAVRDTYAPEDKPLVLFVGTIMPRKGVTELLEALGKVNERLSTPPRVILAGENDLDPSYTETVHEKIRELNLADHITLPGFVPPEDLPALYALADIYVLPSLEEGFGMTALEAMAAGTPVVASRVGALPNLIEPGIHGELAETGDVDSLATALYDMLAGPSDRAEMGEHARRRARNYSWSNVAGQFIDVYEAIDT